MGKDNPVGYSIQIHNTVYDVLACSPTLSRKLNESDQDMWVDYTSNTIYVSMAVQLKKAMAHLCRAYISAYQHTATWEEFEQLSIMTVNNDVEKLFFEDGFGIKFPGYRDYQPPEPKRWELSDYRKPLFGLLLLVVPAAIYFTLIRDAPAPSANVKVEVFSARTMGPASAVSFGEQTNAIVVHPDLPWFYYAVGSEVYRMDMSGASEAMLELPGTVTNLALSGDGNTLVTVDSDLNLAIHDTSTGQGVSTNTIPEYPYEVALFGDRAVWGAGSGGVYATDKAGHIEKLPGVERLMIARSNSLVALALSDSEATVQMASGADLLSFTFDETKVPVSFDATPNADAMVVVSSDGTLTHFTLSAGAYSAQSIELAFRSREPRVGITGDGSVAYVADDYLYKINLTTMTVEATENLDARAADRVQGLSIGAYGVSVALPDKGISWE